MAKFITLREEFESETKLDPNDDLLYALWLELVVEKQREQISFLSDANNFNNRFYDYDKRGVRPFVRYSTSNGRWSIECFRKKREDEIKNDCDWQMIREGSVQSYKSRKEAEQAVLELAEKICLEHGF